MEAAAPRLEMLGFWNCFFLHIQKEIDFKSLDSGKITRDWI